MRLAKKSKGIELMLVHALFGRSRCVPAIQGKQGKETQRGEEEVEALNTKHSLYNEVYSEVVPNYRFPLSSH